MQKECKIHGVTEFRNTGRARCLKCAVISVQKRRSKVKLMAIEYKGGKCSICGYDKYQGALDFHHLSGTKEFGISTKGHCRKWDDIRVELDKCILVCANCHREIHGNVAQR